MRTFTPNLPPFAKEVIDIGLDITVYSKVNPTTHRTPLKEDGTPVTWCQRDNHHQIWSVPGFAVQLGSLEAGRCYTYSDEFFGFRAGSYSGYNEWRDDLAHTMHNVSAREIWDNLDHFKGKPFIELINFSDCEGYIGPEVAAKLYGDFAAYRPTYEKAHDRVGDHVWLMQKYDDWQRAFEMAGGGGMVVFH